ncbi:hypothetical protein Q4566_05255 [Tamlana sp. 2_MG-2023]|uniref:hypothetical protein n=1 Tax=unclassified Tamlana TaxID=2614803 RepID=UPI0026E3895A|nr:MULTISPECIES: hypothetical protein [unclassified Tamlana]MDO6759601.1 hypothetical protein [Tamlana sp. 2_MG-2023]MDO6792172.1 hypothetical protein [Tamlana sp. 1_MG-2023]
MKLSILKLLTLSLVVLISSCSSVKELNHWTSNDVATIKSQNILVIVKAKKSHIRESFEKQITKQLKAENLNATSSYEQFPELNPNDTLTKAELAQLKEKFQKAGFNGIVFSRVIGVEKLTNTTTSGGYEAGATLGDYPYLYDMGFYGFYSNTLPMPSFEGVYEPMEIQTQTANIYVLETVVYNLDLETKKQMVASVTSKIENVETGHNLAKNYAKTIVNGVKKK